MLSRLLQANSSLAATRASLQNAAMYHIKQEQWFVFLQSAANRQGRDKNGISYGALHSLLARLLSGNMTELNFAVEALFFLCETEGAGVGV